jgi:predicted RecB family nuclease
VLGIGPIYKCRLETLDIRTIGQLAVAQPAAVAAALGVSSRRAAAFVEAANRLLSD